MIVRCSVLLDPNDDNYYHATNIWFSVHGYVTLGKFPIMPDNVYIIGIIANFFVTFSDRK
jgi:hypothetical protein